MKTSSSANRPTHVPDSCSSGVKQEPNHTLDSPTKLKNDSGAKRGSVPKLYRNRLAKTWPISQKKLPISTPHGVEGMHSHLKEEVYKKIQKIDWRRLVRSGENASHSSQRVAPCGAKESKAGEVLTTYDRRQQLVACPIGLTSTIMSTASSGSINALSETYADLVDRWISEESTLDHLPDNVYPYTRLHCQ